MVIQLPLGGGQLIVVDSKFQIGLCKGFGGLPDKFAFPDDGALAVEIAQRLDLFRQGKPYRLQ